MTSKKETALFNALEDLLYPLVRLAMRHEVTHEGLTEALRLQFVRVAIEHHGDENDDITNHRIAIITGLNRKEVSRLRDRFENNSIQERPLNRTLQVVQGWLDDKEFLDRNKDPLTLPITNMVKDVEKGSFKALVRKFSKDINYRPILEELNRMDMTTQPTAETIRLKKRTYIPKGNEPAELQTISENVTDVFNTALFNTDSSNKDRRLQRVTVYSGIPESDVQELREYIKAETEVLIKKLEGKLGPIQKKARNLSRTPKTRIGLSQVYIEGRKVSDTAKKKK